MKTLSQSMTTKSRVKFIAKIIGIVAVYLIVMALIFNLCLFLWWSYGFEVALATLVILCGLETMILFVELS